MEEKVLVTQSSMPPYEEYIKAIKPLWDSHWLTNMGHYHQELERRLRDYLDVEEVSLVVNGHMALELAIQAMNFPENAEVITTPFTFISTTHAIVRNHLQPVFCDVKVSDGTIDETKIEELITEKTVAIIPVHVYGNICNVEVIENIAYKYGLKVIYDAAHAFGETYKGKNIAQYGDASVFSFHATKVFNTIEGGAITFSNRELYDKLYNLKNFGISGGELVVDIGVNAKMNEFAAIMGLCNLDHIDEVLEARRVRYEYYKGKLDRIDGIHILESDVDTTRNYAYFPIIIQDIYKRTRDEMYDALKLHNIYVRKYFCPLTSDQVCFKNKYKNANLKVARELARKVLILPLSAEISFETIDRVINVICE